MRSISIFLNVFLFCSKIWAAESIELNETLISTLDKENIDLAQVTKVLDDGANVNFGIGKTNCNYSTPLQYAIHRHSIEAARLLLTRGADANGMGCGKTPLHVATNEFVWGAESFEIFELLLAAKGDLNKKDLFFKESPLGWALVLPKPNEKLANYLLDHGAAVDNEPFIRVCWLMSEELIRRFVSLGANVAYKSEYQSITPLHRVAARGLKNLVEIFLKNGASINALDTNGNSPLHMAFLSGDLDTIKYLLSKGADPKQANNSGRSLIHFAASSGAVSAFNFALSFNPEINLKDENGITPYHLAAESGSIELVEFLTAHGANLNAKDDTNATPLHFAVSRLNLGIVRYLISHGAQLDASSKSTNLLGEKFEGTPLRWAIFAQQHASKANLELVEVLLESGANPNSISDDLNSLLYDACLRGRFEIANLLLKHGADPNLGSKGYERSPLAAAVMSLGYLKKDSHRKDLETGMRTVTLLLEKGAKVNVFSRGMQYKDDSFTPLYLAARGNLLELVEKFLEYGADPNVVLKYGRTALFEGIGNLEITRALLKKGANPNVVSEVGDTAIFSAVRNADVDSVKLLIEAGADLSVRDMNGETPLSSVPGIAYRFVSSSHGVIDSFLGPAPEFVRIGTYPIDGTLSEKLEFAGTLDEANALDLTHKRMIAILELLIKKGSNLHNLNLRGQSPLFRAASAQSKAIAKIFLDSGLDVNLRDLKGQTPLMYMVLIPAPGSQGSLVLGKNEMTEFLISRGANVNIADNQGLTALHWAARYGNIDVVKILLKHGASRELLDKSGKTAYDYALKNKYNAIAKILAE